MTFPYLKPVKPVKVGEGVVPQVTPELPELDEDTFLETMDRLYPDIAATAKSPVDVAANVYDWANTDPDAFLADLMSKGRTRDTEILLQGFGFKGEQIDQLWPETPSDEETARILRQGGLSEEEINRFLLRRRTVVPGAELQEISFWEDPAGWWERRHQEYIERVPSEQKAEAIRRETLAEMPGIIGLVTRPLWSGGLSATDIAGIGLLAYGGYQAAVL